jgi:hypothetical protein
MDIEDQRYGRCGGRKIGSRPPQPQQQHQKQKQKQKQRKNGWEMVWDEHRRGREQTQRQQQKLEDGGGGGELQLWRPSANLSIDTVNALPHKVKRYYQDILGWGEALPKYVVAALTMGAQQYERLVSEYQAEGDHHHSQNHHGQHHHSQNHHSQNHHGQHHHSQNHHSQNHHSQNHRNQNHRNQKQEEGNEEEDEEEEEGDEEEEDDDEERHYHRHHCRHRRRLQQRLRKKSVLWRAAYVKAFCNNLRTFLRDYNRWMLQQWPIAIKHLLLRPDSPATFQHLALTLRYMNDFSLPIREALYVFNKIKHKW